MFSYNENGMEENDITKKDSQANKAKKRKKIAAIIVIIGVIIDIILLILFLLLKKNYKRQPTSDNNEDSQYMETANHFKGTLLSIMNDFVDNNLSKPDSQFDITNIVSISTNVSNQVIYTGYNNNYVMSMSLELDNLNNFINDIESNNIKSMNGLFLDIDNISNNPLLEDNEFKKEQYSNMKYKLATNGASHKSLSASYLVNDTYYSITNYQYEIGEFHYENITEDNKTGYSVSTNPVMYYLLASL